MGNCKSTQDGSQPGGKLEAGAYLKSWEDLKSRPTFPNSEKTMLSKHLTADVWNQLKDKEDSYGYKFKQAIFTGCKLFNFMLGVYAGSANSYDAFQPLLDPIIEDYYHCKLADLAGKDLKGNLSEGDNVKLEKIDY